MNLMQTMGQFLVLSPNPKDNHGHTCALHCMLCGPYYANKPDMTHLHALPTAPCDVTILGFLLVMHVKCHGSPCAICLESAKPVKHHIPGCHHILQQGVQEGGRGSWHSAWGRGEPAWHSSEEEGRACLAPGHPAHSRKRIKLHRAIQRHHVPHLGHIWLENIYSWQETAC